MSADKASGGKMEPIKRKRRKPVSDIDSADKFYDVEKVASSMECTGLIPSAAKDEEEAESYGELYAIHTPKPDVVDEKSRESE